VAGLPGRGGQLGSIDPRQAAAWSLRCRCVYRSAPVQALLTALEPSLADAARRPAGPPASCSQGGTVLPSPGPGGRSLRTVPCLLGGAPDSAGNLHGGPLTVGIAGERHRQGTAAGRRHAADAGP